MRDDSPTLDMKTMPDERYPVVQLKGDVDLRTSPDLRENLLQLIKQRPERLILDLAGVGYMDSSGVGTMVELKRRIERRGGELVLAGLQPRVRSLLEITRLDQFFTIASSVDEARGA
jgi:anti-sigma B factor antagonist